MNDRHNRQGSIARAASVASLFLMVSIGIVLGGILFAVLSLSALAARAVRRLAPSNGVRRDPGARDDVVIEGSYVVLEEGLPRAPNGPRATGH